MSTITIAGNIGKDPELRYSGAGNAFMTLPVAVTTGRDDKKETHWFDVKFFGDMAELMAELPKGQRVVVYGRMKQDSWETKEGEKRNKMCLYADEAGPSLRWAPKRKPRDKIVEDAAVEAVKKGFADGTEPF